MSLIPNPRAAIAAAATLLIVAVAQAFAAPPSERGHPREAVKLARQAIQQGRPAQALELIHRAQLFLAADTEQQARRAGADALDRKLQQLEAVAQRRLRSDTKSGDGPAADSQPALWLGDPDAPGARCQRPLASGPERPTAVRLDAAGGQADVWIRWSAPAPGTFALTAASVEADPSLEIFADCADSRPLSANDDHDGLDAQALVRAGHVGQVFMVKASNVGDEPGVVEVKGFTVRTISGRVTNAAGSALSSIKVAAFDPSYHYDIASTYTGQDGRYTLAFTWSELAGPFTVRTGQTTPMYVDEAWDDVPCASNRTDSISDCPGATALTIDESGAREGIDFTLDEGERIHGRVLNARDGVPVADAIVNLITVPGEVRSARTDMVGRFSFGAVAAGSRVYLHASHPEFASQLHAGAECAQAHYCDLSQGTAIVVQPDRTVVDVSLLPRSFIEVALTVEGEPPALDWYGPTINVRHANGALVHGLSLIPVDQGRYRVGPLSAGTYLLSARMGSTFQRLHAGLDCATDCVDEIDSGSPIVIEAEGDVPSVAIDLRPLPSLSGRVVDAVTGEPIEATLRLISNAGTHYPRTADTDEQGGYIIESIPTGSYHLIADAPGYTDRAYPAVDCEQGNPADACPLAEPLAFGLDSDVLEADFALDTAPAVVGSLLGDGERLTETFSFGSSAVTLLHTTGASVGGTNVRFDVDTSTYRLTDYAPGSYFVAARVWRFHSQIADGVVCPDMHDWSACAIGDARRYALADEDVSIDFDLRSYGVRYVLVRDEASRLPIAGVGIDLWDSLGRPVGSVLTGQAGRVAVSGNGPIRLSTDNYFGYADQVYAKIECGQDQSVYRGNCSLLGATTIQFPNQDVDAGDIVFSLRKAGAVFADGFD